MKFTKMHGAGNDFILVDNREERVPLEAMQELARKLCPRRTAVGADGIMFLNAHEGDDADVDMHFFNVDGSAGEMCGNGARCVSRFAYERGFCAGESARITTRSGLVTGERISKEIWRVRLNDITVRKDNVYAEFEGRRYLVDYLEMGDPGLPHAVVEIPGLAGMDKEDLRPLAVYLRHFFPRGANVNFYEMREDGGVQVLTYERGVEDFTLACGTGAGSTVSDLARLGRVSGEDVPVHVPGGLLSVTVKGGKYAPSRDIWLAGPTMIVYEAETELA